MLTLGADTAGVVVANGPLFSWQNAIALVTLTALEVVLGIDNIVFIAILAGKLPKEKQVKARQVGLALAVVTRILLLLLITVILGLATKDLFTIPLLDHPMTGKDLVLLIGGLFLIFKATHEIHSKVEGGGGVGAEVKAASFGNVIFQILLMDMVFSIDSVVTAVGMAQEISVMIAAVVISVGIMLVFAGRISGFINKHPTMKMLALAFLMLIGVVLVADGLGQHIQKGYIYFAMAFSLGVEVLNLRVRKKTAPAHG